jgi:hypothetical protein
MWTVLKESHLAQAKGALEERRRVLLRRHADELAQLAAEQDEIDALRRLAATFCDKFKVKAAPKSAPPRAPMPAPAARAPHDAWRGGTRGRHQSNFAMFSGALSRAF